MLLPLSFWSNGDKLVSSIDLDLGLSIRNEVSPKKKKEKRERSKWKMEQLLRKTSFKASSGRPAGDNGQDQEEKWKETFSAHSMKVKMVMEEEKNTKLFYLSLSPSLKLLLAFRLIRVVKELLVSLALE